MANRLQYFVAFSAIFFIAQESFSHGEEPEAGAISFEYRDQEFNPEFIDWLAEYGARKKYLVNAGTDLEAIVTDVCGTSSKANLELFKKVIGNNLQNILSQQVEIPPCLPDPVTSKTARVVLPRENFWQYYNKAKSALPNSEFEERPILTYSSENLPEYSKFIDRKVDFFKEHNSFDTTSNLISIYWQDQAEKSALNWDDAGEIAFDATLIYDALKQKGMDASISEILKVGQREHALANAIDLPQIEAAAGMTIARWDGADFGESALIAEAITGFNEQGDDDFLTNVVWIEPTANLAKVKNPQTLQPGDVVVVPTVTSQQVQIPVDRGRLLAAREEVSATEIFNSPKVFTTDNSAEPAVSDLDTFHVDEVFGGQCTGSSDLNWGSVSFIRNFRDAALRARIEAARRGKNKVDATIMVVDSGFITAGSRGPFGGEVLSKSGNSLESEKPSPLLENHHRTHGTAVAGLALGGPDLWGLATSLGIDFQIAPANIFEPRDFSGKTLPVFQNNALYSTIRQQADVYNLSFGSRNKNLMNDFKSNFINTAIDKLFVIAAGNNNLNDSDEGVDVGDASIYPQYWAGNETGYNLLLVASLDGDRLASFSNHSESRISVAAPGCAIRSWKPTLDETVYMESQVSGTSFSAPIVSYVAAVVKALSPSNYTAPPWVRARIIASADLTMISRDDDGRWKIEHGRVLNPVKAVSLYEDVVEVVRENKSQILHGHLQWSGDLNDICDGVSISSEAELMKIARIPGDANHRFAIYSMRDFVLNTDKTCTARAGAAFALRQEDGSDEIVQVSEVKDIVFRYH